MIITGQAFLYRDWHLPSNYEFWKEAGCNESWLNRYDLTGKAESLGNKVGFVNGSTLCINTSM